MRFIAGLAVLVALVTAQVPIINKEENNPCSGRIISAVIDLSPSEQWTDPHRLRVDAAQALFDYYPVLPYPNVIINDPFRDSILTVFSIHDEGHENGQQGGAEEIRPSLSLSRKRALGRGSAAPTSPAVSRLPWNGSESSP